MPLAALRERLRTTDWRPWLLGLYALSVLVVAVPKGLQHSDNTFHIFRFAFANLRAGRDLYVPHPEQYYDLYKYSPAFAVLFAPFSFGPEVVSLVAWDALNTMLLAIAVLRVLPDRRGDAVLGLIFLEMFGAMQHSQSNSLVAALVILTFVALEGRRQTGAAVAIAAGTAIKIFPIAAVAMALPHPRRIRFGFVLAAALVVVFALPLLVVPPHEVLEQYRSWITFLPRDAVARSVRDTGMHTGGVPEQLRLWFGVQSPPWVIEGVGALLLLLPLARRRQWGDRDFRLRFLCSLLVFLVIFNHRAESPTFVIALAGIAMWFVITPRTPFTVSLMTLSLLVVSIGASSAVPNAIRVGVVMHYRLKTIPCLLVWLVMQAELLGIRRLGPGETKGLAPGSAVP